MRRNNKLNIWLAVKYVEKKTKRKPSFLANCFQYLFNALLQFGALTSVFLAVVVVLNFSIFSKERIKIFANNWENRIECFNMIERTRKRKIGNSKWKRTILNKTKIVSERNGMCYSTMHNISKKTKFLSFKFIFFYCCFALAVGSFRSIFLIVYSIGST